jgi:hypothetical protein
MEEWRCSSTILDLGTIWRLVVSFTLLPLYPGVIVPGSNRRSGCVGPKVGLDAVEKRKICFCLELNPGRQNHRMELGTIKR